MGDVNAAVERLLGGGLQVHNLLPHCLVKFNNPFFRVRALGETISL